MSFKESDDNFKTIIKSLRPIKDKFSKESYKHDKYFKNLNFETLEKHLFGPKKSPENFYTSQLYKNIDFMYNLSNDSYDYIANLKGIKNIPIKINKKGINFIKNLYNPEFESKPEEKYSHIDNKPNYIYNLKKYYQNRKIFKFAVYALDPGYYHPKYNYIKKRIPSIDFSKSQNSHDKGELSKIGEDFDINDEIVNKRKKKLNKSFDKINEEEKKKLIINISGNENDIENKKNEDNNRFIRNKSINYGDNILHNNSLNILPIKKSKFVINQKLSLPKIINLNKKIFQMLKINKVNKSKTDSTVSTPVMISFNKMTGRNNIKKEEKSKKKADIEYKPNYEITLPHVRSFSFKWEGNKQNYKKYIIGKILRSYSFNPYSYYVMDIKKKKI